MPKPKILDKERRRLVVERHDGKCAMCVDEYFGPEYEIPLAARYDRAKYYFLDSLGSTEPIWYLDPEEEWVIEQFFMPKVLRQRMEQLGLVRHRQFSP